MALTRLASQSDKFFLFFFFSVSVFGCPLQAPLQGLWMYKPFSPEWVWPAGYRQACKTVARSSQGMHNWTLTVQLEDIEGSAIHIWSSSIGQSVSVWWGKKFNSMHRRDENHSIYRSFHTASHNYSNPSPPSPIIPTPERPSWTFAHTPHPPGSTIHFLYYCDMPMIIFTVNRGQHALNKRDTT